LSVIRRAFGAKDAVAVGMVVVIVIGSLLLTF